MEKAEDIRQSQLNITLKKLQKLSPEEQENLDAMTKAIVHKILNDPIQFLKKNSHDEEEYIPLVNELFQLDREKLK